LASWMVWSRRGPTETKTTGQPVNSTSLSR
jgi:hypothetical protein